MTPRTSPRSSPTISVAVRGSVRFGLGDLGVVLGIAPRRRGPLRAARRPLLRRGSRRRRGVPTARVRPFRRAVRRSRRTTSSAEKNARQPDGDDVHSTTDTPEPNASHDAAGWRRRGHQRNSTRHRGSGEQQPERPAHRVPDGRDRVVVERVTERATERERGEGARGERPGADGEEERECRTSARSGDPVRCRRSG